MDTAWIALVGTIFGGAGLKLMENLLARGQTRSDDASKMREELRKESTDLREELRQVEKALDEWKEKYFILLQEYLEIKGHYGLPKPENKESG